MRIGSISVLVVLLFVGCASNPVTFPPVGPAAFTSSRLFGHGALQVHTALKEKNDGGILYFYPQNYLIYRTNELLRPVINSTPGAEDPAIVNLPAGKYLVRAPSDGYGIVNIPIVIQGGQLTEVHLDRRWRPAGWRTATNLAAMPDGSPIGYHAPVPNQANDSTTRQK